ncbi:DUF305 domain-containing protein [Kovacikia minuta CCNUW1]|uniref:DUF305 domain-containing protein n=1 Tax=Kovacikia minuta TaxID=2931930 RepID=UPI001CC94197|nr:DUF305 domain-containing protein [Kovacikia minuta]UBF24690.1 DUF305 domain-containing protein [Kovacikia minuta CCNUW1]
MKSLNLKAKFLGLAMAIAASSHVLAGCSTPPQTQAQAPTPTATNAGDRQPTGNTTGGMHHDGMKPGGMMDHSTMELGPADAEFDLRFIDSMIPHHEGAVVMAQEVVQKSQRPELKKLAQNIIQAQAKEINQMKQWRSAWYPKAPSTPVAWHAQMGHSMAMSEDHMKAMRMDMDLGTADANFDQRFIDAMIPHHEGAVVMANDALQKSKRPEILQLAKNIIASQQTEIKQMQQWRNSWYGK